MSIFKAYDIRGLHGSGMDEGTARAGGLTPGDELGDVLFAVTTAEVENPAMGVATLGALASETVWDAILGIW